MANFDIAVQKTINTEGGYINDPDDPGGETKYGISKRAFPNEDIKNLTIERAKELYQIHYWRLIKGDEIKSQLIAETIFDFAVNAGVATAVRLIQRGAMIKDDGVIGKQTLEFINTQEEADFVVGYCVLKIQRYIDICEKNPTQKKYFFGWVKRAMP